MQTTDGQTPAKVAEHLRDDEIHVWRFSYKREQGRAPLLNLLGAYLGLPAEHIVLVDGEHGRPALASTHEVLAFNWSHSGDQAVLAIARGVVPGIDLEWLRARPRAIEIAERFFCTEEATALAALEPAQRDAAFLELWTAKEAVLKALGRGLAFGLQRLRFSVPPAEPHLLWLDGDDVAQWQVHRLSFDAGHVATLAWRGAPQQIRYWTLVAED
ncbi:MAG: 4'-phosphopantetheinyl transferase superfamily protein [Rhodanobacter sp.]